MRLGLRKGKRRREPRFWVECRPEYVTESGQPVLRQIAVSIRNDSDLDHRLDEAAVRYDDGRVGAQVQVDGQPAKGIGARATLSFVIPATSLLDVGSATRFRVVVYRGRSGQRLEWSSREERFAPPPDAGA